MLGEIFLMVKDHFNQIYLLNLITYGKEKRKS
jgi:hypothetical protein